MGAVSGRGGDGEAAERGLARGFGALVVLGVVLVGAAVFGLLYTGFATLTSVLLFGWLLLIGGVAGLAHAVLARAANFFWLGASVGALNIAAGAVMIVRPDAAAEGLTLFAALLFLSAGAFRLVGGLAVRGPQFGWTLLLGVLDLIIGLLALAGWPSDSLYTLGLLFSLSLLFDGLALVSIGVGARRVIGMLGEARREAAPAPAPEPAPEPEPERAGVEEVPGEPPAGVPVDVEKPSSP
ncbi:HdeD family acid-resistance protein [Kitasatospora sp. NPDC096147]|uniref:HdeD family acid-resistance protein n=1 Tax=Kitasatospora sp. NPDC096147 TaxID=3364093 RepID=UPI0037F478E5